jgi:hypothetical protein
MKYLKMLGSLFIVAAASMAYVGAGTASGETTACKNTSGSECYGTNTKVEAELAEGEATMTPSSGFGEVRCKKSFIDGKIETATTPSGKLTTLSFTECNRTVTTLEKGTFTVHHQSGNNGIETSSGAKVAVTILGIECEFGGEINGSIIRGGSTGFKEVTITVPELSENFGCPESALLHAVYKITTPNPIYIVTGV